MDAKITIKCEATGDIVNEPIRSIIKYQVFSETYLCQRFALREGSSFKLLWVSGESEYPPESSVPYYVVDGRKMWTLRAGSRYELQAAEDIVHSALEASAIDKGKAPFHITELSDDDDDDDVCIVNVVSGLNESLAFAETLGSTSSSKGIVDLRVNERTLEMSVDPLLKDVDITSESHSILKMYRISALESVLAVKGHSEISRFVQRRNFLTQQVRCLPPLYNGDIIFELPPIKGDGKKGERVQSMERSKDCYFWTQIVPTSAQVPKKKLWQFGKVMCTGSLECRNDRCGHFDEHGFRNSVAWKGNSKMSTKHKVNEPVEEDGLVCGFCEERPFCISGCPVTMFFMYPNKELPPGTDRDEMSRLCLHQGNHDHLPRHVFSRDSFEKMGALLKKQYDANPSAPPSRLRNNAIGELIAQFQPESASGLSHEDETELWESLQLISTPQKFLSLLRSVRRDGKPNGIFDALRHMQENVVFPYIQRYRVPGQGSEMDFPFILKMFVKGHGCGVDLLRRMLLGKSLHGSWVMFDVMRRITTGWLTFSAHVYDHNYRALCTIFTCELMAEDAASCEIPWVQMIDVARQHGLPKVFIHGFMADNAIGGWNAVRKVFFGGTREPERERSDAFHWEQSLHRHTREGIKEGSQMKHFELWRKLCDAENVVAAYKIAHEITIWWKDGNCYPEKLRFLEGWLAWWVVRWTL